MSEGVNKAILLGQLGADPELRFTQGGQAILNMRLATTEVYFDKDQQKKERTEWHSVSVWGKRAEALSKILQKGSGVFIEGRIQTSSYEKEGEKRYRTEIVANSVVLTGSKPRGADAPPGGGRSADQTSSGVRGGNGGGRRAPDPDDDGRGYDDEPF